MKKIVVTGDSGDLGAAIVDVLLNNPEYAVIGISRRETPQMEAWMKQFPDRYRHIEFDLSDSAGIKNLYLNRIKNLGPVFGLVNNAAFAYDDIVTNANYDRLNRMFHINVYSPVLLTKYLIRDMLLHNTAGSFVHISSVSAHTGYKGLSMYAASKGALESFSRTVAREWGIKGIRSNCVAPGFMETSMSESMPPDLRKKIFNRTALRKPTDIQPVAQTVEFLLSDKSKSITGSVIHVDSGTI